MRQVIIVSLGDNAYNIDDEGYRALRKYLDRASAGLKNNPDAAEILADLERGIGARCAGALSANKNVVSAEDLRRILQEIGPVDGVGPEEPEAPPAPETAAPSVKVLRRRIQGSSIAGVCTGLADYFGVDVLIARLAFVALALMTGGVGVLLYVIMAFVVPADSASAAPPIVAGARALSPKTITVIAIACLLLAVFYAIVSVGGRSHMPGLLELLIGMLLSFGFFGTIAAILVGLAFIVIRFLRSATR